MGYIIQVKNTKKSKWRNATYFRPLAGGTKEGKAYKTKLMAKINKAMSNITEKMVSKEYRLYGVRIIKTKPRKKKSKKRKSKRKK